MPELPEVETVVRQLRPALKGRVIHGARIVDPKLRPLVEGRRRGETMLRGAAIEEVFRAGKHIVIHTELRTGKAAWLAIHLRMTGRLYHKSRADLSEEQRRHLRMEIELDRGRLYFVDTRRFGTARLLFAPEAFRPAGTDPLSAELGARELKRLIAGSRQQIKSWLLRQDRLVGLGNIYAAEALYAAGIDPARQAGSMSNDEVRRLHRQLRRILRAAIRMCGTTFSDFQDTRGLEGGFQAALKVYGREGERCPRCGETVKRYSQQQRSTFWCPGCQA